MVNQALAGQTFFRHVDALYKSTTYLLTHLLIYLFIYYSLYQQLSVVTIVSNQNNDFYVMIYKNYKKNTKWWDKEFSAKAY